MKETTISILALLALFLLKVVLADYPPINETFDLEVFQGNALHSYPRCGAQGGGEKCIKTGECCSIWGWCGTTSAYCAPGNCQSQCPTPSPPPSPSPPPPPPPSPPPPSPPPPPPPSPPPPPPSPPPPSPSPPPPPPSQYPRCGAQGGGGKCIKTGECCSIWGWCGTTSAYCAPGNCQSQCPTPSPPPSPSPPPPPPPSPPPPSPPPPPPSPPPPSPPPPPPSPPPPSPSPPPPPPSQYPRCGRQGGDRKCIKIGECCSIWGWCGTTPAYCAPGNCQSQCPTLTSSVKNRMRGIESFYLNVVNI